MSIRKWIAWSVAGATLSACGLQEKKHASSDQAATEAADAAPAGATLENYVALGPNDLALKIRAAFGRNMTLYTVKGASVDYLVANGTLFTGAISGNPYTIIPSALDSVPYFMAVEALGEVVAGNYANDVVSGVDGIVANDCRQTDGAAAIVQVTYPQIDAATKAAIAADIVTSCTTDGLRATVEAIVKSYAFLAKGQE